MTITVLNPDHTEHQMGRYHCDTCASEWAGFAGAATENVCLHCLHGGKSMPEYVKATPVKKARKAKVAAPAPVEVELVTDQAQADHAEVVANRAANDAAAAPQPIKVNVWGPNLGVDGPTFHVHTVDCADQAKGIYKRIAAWNAAHDGIGDSGPWTMDASGFFDIVTDIYPPSEFLYDAADEQEISNYGSDVKVFPCVRFPVETVTIHILPVEDEIAPRVQRGAPKYTHCPACGYEFKSPQAKCQSAAACAKRQARKGS